MRVPSFGVIDVPSGCSAHTDDWVLPASFHSQSQFKTDPVNFNFTYLSLNPPVLGSTIPNSPFSERKQVVENLTDTINEMINLQNRDRPLEGLKIQYLRALAEKVRHEKRWIGQIQCPFDLLIMSVIICVIVTCIVLWILYLRRISQVQFTKLQHLVGECIGTFPDNWQITESSDEGDDTRESSEGHSATTQASRTTPHPTPKPALRRKVLPEAVRQ